MVANNFFSSKNSFLKLIIFWGITMKLFPWWAFSVVTYLEINNAKMSGNVCSHFVKKQKTLAMEKLRRNREKSLAFFS